MLASLTSLPSEILTQIVEYLSLKELFLLNSTAKFFQPVVNDVLIKKLKSQQVKQIATGNYHNLILQQDGRVWGCGNNDCGQLGIGSNGINNIRNEPVKVLIEGVQQIFAGSNHSLFLKRDGTVWGCGNNCFGQFGTGNKQNQNKPVRVLIDEVQQIFAGGDHTFFLKKDGTVWGCGNNSSGQLGIGNNRNQDNPVKVPIDGVQQISAGPMHTFFLKTDGTVLACGYNPSGQLGIGNPGNQMKPVKVLIEGVQKIITGDDHTFFLKKDGSVWGCGYNNCGQLGIGYDSPVQYNPVEVFVEELQQVTARSTQTFFLKKDGSVWGCGNNYHGQLGIGSSGTGNDQNKPVKALIEGVQQVSTGAKHTLFLKTDGTVWDSGYNDFGQLGMGNKENEHQNKPQAIPKYQKLQAILQKLEEKNNPQAQIGLDPNLECTNLKRRRSL